MTLSVGCYNRTQDIKYPKQRRVAKPDSPWRPGRVHRTDSTASRDLHYIATCILRDREEAKDQVQKAYWKAHGTGSMSRW